jgi:phosphopantetheinyl transferase
VPRNDELFVWFGVPASDEVAAAALAASNILDAAEGQQALSADRKSFIEEHAMPQMMITSALACAPGEVHIVRDERNKPRLSVRQHGEQAANLHFNISHTHGLCAVALAGRHRRRKAGGACESRRIEQTRARNGGPESAAEG